MRTKYGKRLWLAPATLGVIALAALLAFGLMAANGPAPAAAQSGVDCTVKNTGTAAAGTEDTPVLTTTDAACSTTDSSAVVALQGAIGLEDADDLRAWVYAQNGDITGGTTHNNIWDHGASAAAGDAAPEATRFSAVRVEIPEGQPAGTGGGGPKRSTTNVTVTPISGQNVVTLYVYYQAISPVPAADFNHDTVGGTDDVLQIDDTTADTAVTITITFLGKVAVGKDLGTDRNKILDEFRQCGPGPDGVMDSGSTNYDGDMANCTAAGDDVADTNDKAESRSRLVAFETFNNRTVTVMDGGTKDFTYDPDNDGSVRVYAVIEDAKGLPLPGLPVTYSFENMPAKLDDLGARTADAEEVTKTVVSSGADVDDEDKQIHIADSIAGHLDVDNSATGDAHDTDEDAHADAVALHSVRLPPDNAAPYRVKVTVMAQGVNLGSIVVAIPGDPSMMSGGVYNSMCVGGDDMDQFDTNMKDCEMVMGSAARFPRGGKFAVSADVTDSAGTKIKTGRNSMWTIKDLSRSNVVSGELDSTGTRGYVLTVKDDAKYGMHTLTLTHPSDDIDDMTLDFYVAGPPASYQVTPMPDAMDKIYSESRRITLTITAVDENGGVPHFTTVDDTDTVNKDERNHRVLVDAIDGTIRGTDANDYLTLDTDTGMNSFRYTMPRDAEAGEEFDITIGEGDIEKEVTVVYGEAPAEKTVPGKPMNVMADAQDHMSIEVSWDAPSSDGHSAITGYIIERRYEGDMMGDIPSDGYSGTNGANRSFAFSNAMEWWETLNCKGMLGAAGSSEMPAAEGEDKSAHEMMYCAHFLNTAPSNVTDSSVELSADAKMAVGALFAKRYVVGIDAMTMMYTDMGLMADTEYTYRVSAVNAEGRGMWSDAAMETTDANTAPTAGDAIADVMVEEGATATAQSTITDPEGDTLTWSAMSSASSVATATVDNMGMVTISGHMAGMATITVTAMDADGSGMSASQKISVTVSALPLTAPTNVREVLNTAGSLVVGWNAATGAEGYVVIAINISDFSSASSVVGVGVNSGGVSVVSGQTYNVYVASFDSETYILSESVRITAE